MMKTYKDVFGSQTENPQGWDFDSSPDTIYYREDVRKIEIDGVKLWQYNETQYSVSEFGKIHNHTIQRAQMDIQGLNNTVDDLLLAVLV